MSSSLDFLDLLNTAFKDYDPQPGRYGHALLHVGTTRNGKFMPMMEDASPHAGKLMLVTQNQQRYTTDTTVTITYYKAVVDEEVTRLYNDRRYTVTKYKADGTDTVQVTIPAGTYEGKAFLLDVFAAGVENIEYDDPFQEFDIYLIGDVGAGLLYGFNTDKWRDDLVTAFHSYFTHPPMCIRCSGTSVDSLSQGSVCPDCHGYGYVGWYASGSMLTTRAHDFGVQRRGVSDEELSMLVWSARMYTFPSKKGIKEHLAFMLNVDDDEIYITEHNDKEYYYEVEFPIYGTGRINPYGRGMLDILENIRPAGISVVARPYIVMTSSGAMILWFPAYVGEEHPTLGSGHTKLANDNIDITVPDLMDRTAFINGTFSTEIPFNDITVPRYSDIDGGSYDIQRGYFFFASGVNGDIVSVPDPIFSGNVQLTPPVSGGFFGGLTSDDEYSTKILLDSVWYEVI